MVSAKRQTDRISNEGKEFLIDEPVGELETVAQFYGPMPTGVTVSHEGRIFVCYPKWGDDVEYTVAEITSGEAVAYPSEEYNQPSSNADAEALVSVQSVVVDPRDRLWILDTGSPMFAPTEFGGPKLVCVDLETNEVIKTIPLPQDVAYPTTYLNDVRFDLRRGDEGVAYITDSSDKGANGIIVVDLASGESWRKLSDHPSTKAEDMQSFLPMVEGRPFLQKGEDGSVKIGSNMGSDGIAISAEGDRLYYCPLGSRRLYSVETDVLVDRALDDEEVGSRVRFEGDRGGASDGLESDADGYIYSTNYEHNSVQRRREGGQWETVVHDPRLLWPDTLSLATDGYLYITANQLHRQSRYHDGKDLRQKPYALLRVHVDAEPVLLR